MCFYISRDKAFRSWIEQEEDALSHPDSDEEDIVMYACGEGLVFVLMINIPVSSVVIYI